MSYLFNSSISSFTATHPMKFIVGIVLFVHLALLGIGIFWNHAVVSRPQERTKVFVQTIHLKPSTLITEAKIDKEEKLPISIPASQEIQQVSLKKEEPLPPSIPEAVPKIESSIPKAEKPKELPKSTPKQAKANDQKPAVPKKTVESAKKNAATLKPQAKDRKDPIKKQQQEEAEKKRKEENEIAAKEIAKNQARLAAAKENLAKISERRDKTPTSSTLDLKTTDLPKTISLQVDALPFEKGDLSENWGIKEVNYRDEVAYRLKQALKFPDYGAVKIKLTLDQTGKVMKLETLYSESVKNRTYVENQIPSLIFSSFGQRFPGSMQQSFLFTLQNEDKN